MRKNFLKACGVLSGRFLFVFCFAMPKENLSDAERERDVSGRRCIEFDDSNQILTLLYASLALAAPLAGEIDEEESSSVGASTAQ